MTRSQKSFLLKMARALGACQLVEFELKFYITRAFELCAKRTAGFPPFAMTGRKCDNAPLERLIQAFRELSDCPRLVKRLTAFKAERNFLAHRAIAVCMDPDGDFEFKKAKAIVERLEKAEQEALALIDTIREESDKWLGHLYFDSIDE